MTTHTGATEMTLETETPPPTFGKAMAGALVQLGTLAYVWMGTSAGPCLRDPVACLSDFGSADPWGRHLVVTLCCIVMVWVLSVVTGLLHGMPSDPSIVDRLWSVVPVFYVAAAYLSAPTSRGGLMLALVTVWGARLTYNFAIKGGFSGGEDYRWAVIKKWFPGVQWECFNLVFVVFFQSLEILAFSAPAVYTAGAAGAKPLTSLDAVATGLFALLVLGEAVADRQQFRFQTEKYRRIKAKEELGPYYGPGFISDGLWAFSRHPNYFCEVSMWWVYYLFSVAATGEPLNWCICGPIFLTLLFVPPGASISMTENLASRKYPGYRDYQREVSRFVPWWPKKKKSN